MINVSDVLDQIERQGYALIEPFLTSDQLEILRMESELVYELAQEGRPAAAEGSSGSRWGAEHKASCIYEGIPGHACSPEVRISYGVYKAQRNKLPLGSGVWRIMFESQLAELVLALLGPGAVLFNDQYILKPPFSPLSAFRWHRDSDWCRGTDVCYRPYISVWIALDDMTPDNGCFVVKPGSHLQGLQAGGRGNALGAGRVQQSSLTAVGGTPSPAAKAGLGTSQLLAGAHTQEQQPLQQQGEGERDCRKQQGACSEAGEAEGQPALPLCVRAGTAIVTSDTVLHCSGPNLSRHTRRAWMPQFSAGPILWKEGGLPVGLAIPLRP